MEALIIFGASILFYYERLELSAAPVNKLIMSGALLFVFGIFMLKLFVYLTFIWERTMTFVSFIMSVSLIFGSKIPIIKEINSYLFERDINFTLLLIEIIIFTLVYIIIKRKSIYKIQSRGF